MQFLIEPDRISQAINNFAQANILWLDTEIADYQTKTPKLSLIQVLDDSTDLSGDRVIIFDVLEQPDLIDEFIEKIMVNPVIEKVFHNAKYDQQFLGKSQAKNLTCTLEMAKKIPYYILPINNYKLYTLATQLCSFSNIDKSEQGGNWGQRPLTNKQLEYAKMDAIYLAQVHQRLIQLSQRLETDSAQEDLSELTLRYRQIEHRWKLLDTEFKHLKERLKQAMATQNVSETDGFKLSIQERRYKKVSFNELAKIALESDLDLDLSLRLTQDIQKQITNIIDLIHIEEEVEQVLQLKVTEAEDDDLPF